MGGKEQEPVWGEEIKKIEIENLKDDATVFWFVVFLRSPFCFEVTGGAIKALDKAVRERGMQEEVVVGKTEKGTIFAVIQVIGKAKLPPPGVG